MRARLLWTPSANVMLIEAKDGMDFETFRASVEDLIDEAMREAPDGGPPPLIEWER